MTCPGKEVLGVVAQQLGFKDKRTMVKYVIHAWRDEELPVPTELRDIWGYIQAC